MRSSPICSHPAQTPILATAENAKDFFNGKDLTGWDGDPKLWKVEDGEIVGKRPGIKKNEFLHSHMLASDFRLTLKVKLLPNKENSGIQFRSEALPDGDVRGPQADVGEGWWGKLYEENGRGMLWDKSGEKHSSSRANGTSTRSSPRAAGCGRSSTATHASIWTTRSWRGAASSRSRCTPAGRWRCGSRTFDWR